jgi:hypothetical protein
LFRDADGNAVPGVCLKFGLCDFFNPRFIEKHGPFIGEISISSSELCRYLSMGETWLDRLKEAETNEHEVILPPGIRKRRRIGTPPEELRLEDEHQFQTEEHDAIKQQELVDSSFSATSSFSETGPDSVGNVAVSSVVTRSKATT